MRQSRHISCITKPIQSIPCNAAHCSTINNTICYPCSFSETSKVTTKRNLPTKDKFEVHLCFIHTHPVNNHLSLCKGQNSWPQRCIRGFNACSCIFKHADSEFNTWYMWIVVDETLIRTFIFNTRQCISCLLLQQQQLGKHYQEDCYLCPRDCGWHH